MQSRTCHLNALRMENVGEKVTLVGWLENIRKVSKNLAFLVLRDFYGKTQAVVETEEMMSLVNEINCESTIRVEGVVRERTSKNPHMATGDIEVVCEKIEVLGKCMYNELPFEINFSKKADENMRLKYRYLDLRNPEVKKNIVLRSHVIVALRKRMIENDFLEITTPILTSSSPEGARDYLVPSRNFPGQFYALPQAPQQFKQLLMASGFDRYFQIAPCFRDEDARADRSPGEFYQLDMEMAFASQEDVFSVIEDVIPKVFEEFGIYKEVSKAPFVRIPYKEAMEKYGTDKPDLRIDLTVTDVTDLMKDVPFEAFQNKEIKAVVVDQFTESRKLIDKVVEDVFVQTANKPFWFKVDENNKIVGGIAKFLQDREEQVIKALELKPNTLVAIATGTKLVAQKTAGALVKMLGALAKGHMQKECYRFCWIVDFPMYEIGEESGKLEFCHNPFSMPQGGLKALEKAQADENKALSLKAFQYDLVCNGVELSSGAVRNHDPEIMIKAFELVGLGEAEVKSKFPAMYNAFCYGAPPHAGIAPGVDRMIMLISGEESIREIIPFPMNKKAQDIMMGAPSTVDEKQLKEVHIQIVKEEKEEKEEEAK